MRYQDQVVRATQKALDDVCRAALAVPSDKRTWIPMGAARSVLDQMRELASADRLVLPLLRDGRWNMAGSHDSDSEGVRDTHSIEACVEAARKSTREICQAISAFPDSKLDLEVQLPFATMTMADVLAMHAWNLVYHLGQINQIQLMLGDREMH